MALARELGAKQSKKSAGAPDKRLDALCSVEVHMRCVDRVDLFLVRRFRTGEQNKNQNRDPQPVDLLPASFRREGMEEFRRQRARRRNRSNAPTDRQCRDGSRRNSLLRWGGGA